MEKDNNNKDLESVILEVQESSPFMSHHKSKGCTGCMIGGTTLLCYGVTLVQVSRLYNEDITKIPISTYAFIAILPPIAAILGYKIYKQLDKFIIRRLIYEISRNDEKEKSR